MDTSTGNQEQNFRGPVKGREYPFTDWRLPPDFEPQVQYTARYCAWSGRKASGGNIWWDMAVLKDTPEEVHEFMAKHHKDAAAYVVYKVTTSQEIIDTSRMDYEPEDPYYIKTCTYTHSHTRDFCGYDTCRES